VKQKKNQKKVKAPQISHNEFPTLGTVKNKQNDDSLWETFDFKNPPKQTKKQPSLGFF
jgi:hypothetical protein